ncbi:DUF6283 family protein [Nocardia sp. NPDC004168]|uniref:DUF6283 family protein n=1 Tax=Nocardia sp. NPDC004168 TaxID=3154452 RepID=UPI0033AD12F2
MSAARRRTDDPDGQPLPDRAIRRLLDLFERPSAEHLTKQQQKVACALLEEAAGWVGCHGDQLLALRLGLVAGEISPDTYRAAITYQSPTPLFDSGAQATAHGRTHISIQTAADAWLCQ